MKNRKGFPGVVALGIVVLLVALSPVLATESDAPKNPDGFQAMKRAANNSALAALAETEGGAATKGRITNMFLVDGANGGTIYEYNYELRQIIRTCPTPVPANGIDADGLAYAGPRPGSPARLFYSNATGPNSTNKLVYELDIDTCAVVRTIDSVVATSLLTNIMDLAWGESGITGAPVLYVASPLGVTAGDPGAVLPNGRFRSFDVDNPVARVDSINLGAAIQGTVGADFDGNNTDLIAALFFQDTYPDINAFDMGTAFTWLDFIDTTENVKAAGLDHVYRRTDPNNSLAHQIREYHSAIAPTPFCCDGGSVDNATCSTDAACNVCQAGSRRHLPCTTDSECPDGAGFSTCDLAGTCTGTCQGYDTIYEYSGAIVVPAGAAYGRVPLSSVANPTPGAAVTDIAVGDLDADFDGIMDLVDNCKGVRSTDVADGDIDTVGDACDNCPNASNVGQEDGDRDGVGDTCDLIVDPITLPVRTVFLTDGYEGGTIYEYDPVAGAIVNSFATPELNIGTCQGLAYSQRRGTLFYTNGSGPTPTFYELDARTGAIDHFAFTSTIYAATSVCGLGVGQIGNYNGQPFGGGATFLYSVGRTGATAQAEFVHDPATFASLTAPGGGLPAGLGGGIIGQGAVGAAEDNSGEIAWGGTVVNGGAYFTRNASIANTGQNRLDFFSGDPRGIWCRRAPSLNGAGGADLIGLDSDGEKLYLSRGSKDGLYVYNLSDYCTDPGAEFGTPIGLRCDAASATPGAVCASNAACGTGLCVDASVAAQPDASFIANPTPGGPITAIGAGIADADFDGDPNTSDNCPTIANSGQEDFDNDGFGDVCDNCPETANSDQLESELLNKFDGVGDVCDNCFELFNPNQEDTDLDGLGDVCDFAPGYVDDSDAIDNTFGPDTPAIPAFMDLALATTRIDICDFDCIGGDDVCCGLAFGSGEPALIVELSVLGNTESPKVTSGTYEVNVDFGEPEAVAGEFVSIKNAPAEPGLAGHNTQDVTVSAKLGQSAGGRAGGRYGASAEINGLAGVENLSAVNQLDGTISFVMPFASLIQTANPNEEEASGLDQDPLGTVEFALWFVARGLGNEIDRAPNTDNNGNPTITEEVTLFQAYFRQFDVDPTTVDFRGTVACGGGDGDLVVVGTGTATSFITIENPSFEPLNVSGITFSDPQFDAPVSFPINISELGGAQTISLEYTPTSVGVHTATGTVLGDDPTPTTFTVVGQGFPNDAPVVSNCTIVPTTVLLGQAPTVSADVSDTASLANVATCRASGKRIAGGTVRFVNLSLVDDASTVGDVACDGRYSRNQATGGLFGRGTWQFTLECTDRQGNVAAPLVCADTLLVL